MPDRIRPAEPEDTLPIVQCGPQTSAPSRRALTAEDAEVLAVISEQRRAQLLWDVQRVTKSSEEAEDIVQEALLRAWRSLQQFRGDAQISTWLRAIVRNTAREWLRNKGSRVSIPIGVFLGDEDDLPAFELTDKRPDPEECCARR